MILKLFIYDFKCIHGLLGITIIIITLKIKTSIMLTYKVLEDPLGQKNTNMCPQLSLDLQSNYTHKPRKENTQSKQHASKFWLIKLYL